MRLLVHLLFFPTLLWNMLLCRVLRLRRWWDWIDDDVLLGALPLASHVPQLKQAGIRAVVNTCEEYAGPVQAYADAGMEQLRVPTVDFTPPSLGDVQRAVDFMQRHVAAGHKVYVHCKAGRGRSATVVLCYFIARGMTPLEAQALLERKRPHIVRRLAERAVVRQFAANLQPENARA